MLSRLLRELEKTSGLLDLNELSGRLGVERSAMEGMLETLVRQGRLREICAAGPSAGCHCGGDCQRCGCRRLGGTMLKSYELIFKPVG